MALKTVLTAALLVLTPAVSAFAQCSSGHSDQAMTCADGAAYDPETGTCKVVTG